MNLERNHVFLCWISVAVRNGILKCVEERFDLQVSRACIGPISGPNFSPVVQDAERYYHFS